MKIILKISPSLTLCKAILIKELNLFNFQKNCSAIDLYRLYPEEPVVISTIENHMSYFFFLNFLSQSSIVDNKSWIIIDSKFMKMTLT